MDNKKKTCTKCGETKSIEQFSKRKAAKDGHASSCKECCKVAGLIYYHKNKEHYKEYSKLYREIHKEERAAKNKIYVQKNRAEVNRRKREWRKKSKEKERAQIRRYVTKRLSYDKVFALGKRTRNAIRTGVKRGGYNKKTRTQEILGCDYKFFLSYIESKFTDGMCWERFNEIHLDHIIPISTAKTEEEVLMLNRYTNFQPLWATDNLDKSDKIIEGTQLILI